VQLLSPPDREASSSRNKNHEKFCSMESCC
jgi:hypothetical protein